jgi:signal transduction histidine kinase
VLTDALVIFAGLLWLGALFAVAVWGERRAAPVGRTGAVIYALSLAVYCTSWTFYGTVTQAAQSGWWLPPTFVGTILLYLLATPVLVRLVRLVRVHNSTSIADLVATRFGRSSGLAALVTAVAVLGIVPYLALQLKAVAMSYAMLTRSNDLSPPAWQDSAFYVALTMALFAMLFGTRRASATEHNRGLVLAMAFEAVLKLIAMLALGAFAVSLPTGAAQPPTGGGGGLFALVVLGGFAMFTLPHQFHVGIVECREPRQLATARWMFPLYMLLIAAPILPLARAGNALLAPRGIPSDLYVLALPLAAGKSALALLAFLGGLSAATGMVILATLSLSLMISNHWIAPLLLRSGWGRDNRGDLRGAVLIQRRVGILAIVLLAWAFSRAAVAGDALADIGAVSFSALAMLGPAVLAAIYRPQIGARATGTGVVVGIAVWIYALLLPLLLGGHGNAPLWLSHGPLGVEWLAPEKLFGLDDWARLSRAVVLGLSASAMSMWLVARWSAPIAERGVATAIRTDGLGQIAQRFLSADRIAALFASSIPDEPAPETLVTSVEYELAAVIGAASARLLVDAARRERGPGLATVAAIVGEASQDLRFNQRLLEAALENMSQGISVVDRELNLVAWNRRYVDMFDYPQTLLRVGVPVAELVRWNAARGLAGDDDIETAVEKRLSHMRTGSPYVTERRFPDGSTVEIRGNPMPGGGFVATFTDVTVFRRTEGELKRVAESLEQRVVERTAELSDAKGEAERANRAKSRFLAAVSHDLAQPLNAAHLFTHALNQQLKHVQYRESVNNIDGALSSAEELLAALLDISRLDSGGMAPRVQAFCVDDLLQHLTAEFRVLAQQKGLELRCVPSRAWVRSDPQLLRRVLQNFLANAVRYTARGRLLIGCRRRADELSMQVWDTGSGIAENNRSLIFEEFRRLDQGGQGLGLGLAIADRIGRLLDHPISVVSTLGAGSGFSIGVPLEREDFLPALPIRAVAPAPPRSRVLVVDNDASVLKAMQALLTGWHCEVLAARTPDEAERLLVDTTPDLLLLDFHLDGAVTGLDLRDRLTPRVGGKPCVIITADHDQAIQNAVAAAGCHLLYKPLKPLALRSVMARVLTALSPRDASDVAAI